jgi:septal ring factor EnvC (AmiA/AmiB activator)
MAAAASGSTAPRRPRRPVVAVLLALVVVLAGAAAAAAAPAAPDPLLVAKAKVLQAKLDAQHAQIERMTERLNAIDERRRTVQSSLGAVRIRQRAAEAELAVAQRRLNEQARATYMHGPPVAAAGAGR